jgi:hypothetical protein
MKKDIFIDANVACKFASTKDPEILKLINWLLKCEEGKTSENAYLMASPKLRKEYLGGASNCHRATSISVIYITMHEEHRLNMISNAQIESFRQLHIPGKKWDNLRCNTEDKYHFPVVFLSDRKFVITEDKTFASELRNFPKFGQYVKCSHTPKDIPYQ